MFKALNNVFSEMLSLTLYHIESQLKLLKFLTVNIRRNTVMRQKCHVWIILHQQPAACGLFRISYTYLTHG